jgi:hypothetical protein
MGAWTFPSGLRGLLGAGNGPAEVRKALAQVVLALVIEVQPVRAVGTGVGLRADRAVLVANVAARDRKAGVVAADDLVVGAMRWPRVRQRRLPGRVSVAAGPLGWNAGGARNMYYVLEQMIIYTGIVYDNLPACSISCHLEAPGTSAFSPSQVPSVDA